LLIKLFEEYDDWYIDAKKLVGASRTASLSETPLPEEKQSTLQLLAHPAISFHYVSELEMQLLYRWVEAPALEVSVTHCRLRLSSINVSLVIAARKDRCGSPAMLRDQWPQTNSEAGDYSRPLSRRSAQEAGQLYTFLIEQLAVY